MTDILDRLFDRTFDLEETLYDAAEEIKLLRVTLIEQHWDQLPVMETLPNPEGDYYCDVCTDLWPCWAAKVLGKDTQ